MTGESEALACVAAAALAHYGVNDKHKHYGGSYLNALKALKK